MNSNFPIATIALIADILCHGPEVEVLTPRELRARCIDALRSVIQIYVDK